MVAQKGTSFNDIVSKIVDSWTWLIHCYNLMLNVCHFMTFVFTQQRNKGVDYIKTNNNAVHFPLGWPSLRAPVACNVVFLWSK